MIEKTKTILTEKIKKIRARHPSVDILTPPKWAYLANMPIGGEISFPVPDGARFFKIASANSIFFSPTQRAVYPITPGEVNWGNTQLCVSSVARDIQYLPGEKLTFYLYNPQASTVHVEVSFWGDDL